MSSNTCKQAAEAARSKASNMTDRGSETVAVLSNGVLYTLWMRATLQFVNGGLSGKVATTVIQPVDMIKVSCARVNIDLQSPFDSIKIGLREPQKGLDGKLPYRGMADCFSKVFRWEGFLLYCGCSTKCASVLRSATPL
ncbi:hypothetical protein DL769_006043 [Monosporascus sp. CRB-8-3]|nr:hypothetical protein DL769_006043 [Monosporascus sp. CRB-8-3]